MLDTVTPRLTRPSDHAQDSAASYRLDRFSRFTAVSPAAAALLGAAADELLGHCIWHRFPALGDSDLHRRCLAILDGGTGQVFLHHDPRADRWYAVAVDPLGPRPLPPTGIEVRFSEVTDTVADRVRAERLDAAATVTSRLAHDFNNGLTVLVGNAEYLADELTDRPDLAEAARLMLETGERAAGLTGRVLQMSRQPERGEFETDIRRAVDRVVARHRHGAEDRRIEMVLEPGLPPVAAEATSLEAALDELVRNALKATPAPGTIRIAAAGGSAGDTILLTVSDDGIGMEPALLKRCIEPFVTLDRDAWGAGLGLAAVHGFATSVGGSLRLDSAPRQGTRATLALPARRRNAALPPDVLPGPGAHVLLVDDDPAGRTSIARSLVSLGWQVTSAASADEALALLREGREPTVLLSDVVLPGGLSGTALADEVHRLRPGLPVLLMSGYAAATPGETAADGARLLAKPFRRADLQRALLSVTAPVRPTAPTFS